MGENKVLMIVRDICDSISIKQIEDLMVLIISIIYMIQDGD
jgi:hypothetical protein